MSMLLIRFSSTSTMPSMFFFYWNLKKSVKKKSEKKSSPSCLSGSLIVGTTKLDANLLILLFVLFLCVVLELSSLALLSPTIGPVSFCRNSDVVAICRKASTPSYVFVLTIDFVFDRDSFGCKSYYTLVCKNSNVISLKFHYLSD